MLMQKVVFLRTWTLTLNRLTTRRNILKKMSQIFNIKYKMGFMHNVTGRISSAFFFGVTVLGILAALNSASSFLIDYSG